MVIDAHVHIFPDAIAERASGNISKFYDLEVRYDGKLSTIMRVGEAAGVRHFLVHSVATTTTQARSINDFMAEAVRAHPDSVTAFAAIHPDQTDMEQEIDRAISMGLKGVKIHPDIQKIDLDDNRFMKLYEIIEGRLPLLAHTGDNRYDHSHPRRMAKVLRAFPRLTAICAHLGGWMQWDSAVLELMNLGAYVDTSSSLAWLSPERAASIIRAFGADRVLFGSDYPMWNPADELTLLRKLPLDSHELDLITHKNAERLLGL